MNEKALEPDEAAAATPADGKPARRVVKKRRKKKPLASGVPSVKVDPVQALAFVRQRLRESKDPIVKALYEREIAEIEKSAKDAVEEKRAKVVITVADSKKARLGDKLYELDESRNGTSGTKVTYALVEYTLTNVIEPKPGEYGGKKASLSKTKGGTKTVEQHSLSMFYLDARSAIDAELKSVLEEIEDNEEQLKELVARRVALEHLVTPQLALGVESSS